MWPKKKKHSEVEALSVLSDAGIVFSDFSAVQSTPDGFILIGTVHFNEAQIDFDEGYCRFLLRSARIHAVATDCAFDYESIAYVHSPSDEAHVEVTVTRESIGKKTRSAAAEGSATASLKTGIGLKAGVRGKLSGDFETSSARTEALKSTEKRVYVRADVRKRGENADHVVWTISPDPANPLEQSGETYDVVHGRRLNIANEGAGLAYVQLNGQEGEVDLALEVRAREIIWTDIEFPETSKLHKLKDRLINGRTKQDIVGRIALGKAFEGRVPLQKVPRKG